MWWNSADFPSIWVNGTWNNGVIQQLFLTRWIQTLGNLSYRMVYRKYTGFKERTYEFWKTRKQEPIPDCSHQQYQYHAACWWLTLMRMRSGLLEWDGPGRFAVPETLQNASPYRYRLPFDNRVPVLICVIQIPEMVYYLGLMFPISWMRAILDINKPPLFPVKPSIIPGSRTRTRQVTSLVGIHFAIYRNRTG